MNETSGPEAMENAKCGELWVEESYRTRLSQFIKITENDCIRSEMNFSYSKGEEVMVNSKSLKMTVGGREPMRIYLCSIPKRNKPC